LKLLTKAKDFAFATLAMHRKEGEMEKQHEIPGNKNFSIFWI
jgi:hypothetical protein